MDINLKVCKKCWDRYASNFDFQLGGGRCPTDIIIKRTVEDNVVSFTSWSLEDGLPEECPFKLEHLVSEA